MIFRVFYLITITKRFRVNIQVSQLVNTPIKSLGSLYKKVTNRKEIKTEERICLLGEGIGVQYAILLKIILSFGALLYLLGLTIFMVTASLNGYAYIVGDTLMPYEAFLLMPLLIGYLAFNFLQNVKFAQKKLISIYILYKNKPK